MSPASYPFQSSDTLAAVTTKIVKKQAWEYVKHWKGGVGGGGGREVSIMQKYWHKYPLAK